LSVRAPRQIHHDRVCVQLRIALAAGFVPEFGDDEIAGAVDLRFAIDLLPREGFSFGNAQRCGHSAVMFRCAALG
jgi:hypothetical protein